MENKLIIYNNFAASEKNFYKYFIHIWMFIVNFVKKIYRIFKNYGKLINKLRGTLYYIIIIIILLFIQ